LVVRAVLCIVGVDLSLRRGVVPGWCVAVGLGHLCGPGIMLAPAQVRPVFGWIAVATIPLEAVRSTRPREGAGIQAGERIVDGVDPSCSLAFERRADVIAGPGSTRAC